MMNRNGYDVIQHNILTTLGKLSRDDTYHKQVISCVVNLQDEKSVDSDTKKRSKRKAELARASRRRKNAHVVLLEDKVDTLKKQVAIIKQGKLQKAKEVFKQRIEQLAKIESYHLKKNVIESYLKTLYCILSPRMNASMGDEFKKETTTLEWMNNINQYFKGVITDKETSEEFKKISNKFREDMNAYNVLIKDITKLSRQSKEQMDAFVNMERQLMTVLEPNDVSNLEQWMNSNDWVVRMLLEVRETEFMEARHKDVLQKDEILSSTLK